MTERSDTTPPSSSSPNIIGEENNNQNFGTATVMDGNQGDIGIRQGDEIHGCSDQCKGKCETFLFPNHVAQFHISLYEAYRNEEFCDATIRTEDNGVFYVHRIVLCGESEYFRALFTSTVNPKPKSEILIRGITAENMDICLQFVYTKKVCLNNESVLNTLLAADYLGLVSLKNVCCEYIGNKLDFTNCFGIYEYTKSLFCDQLEKLTQRFILKNFTEIAPVSEEILELSNVQVTSLFGDELLNVRNEEAVWYAILRWIAHNPEERKRYIFDLLSQVRTGLMDTTFFMEHVKDHPYVAGNETVRPLIIETLRFLYDLEVTSMNGESIITGNITPNLAKPRIPYEVMFAIGGWSGGSPTTFIEAYDTRADRWRPVAEIDPSGSRAYHGTLPYGNEIIVVGGFDGTDYFNSTRSFNFVTKTWKNRAPMSARRCYVSVAMLEGKYIYAMGGYDGHIRQNTAERYDIELNQWTSITPMNAQRSDASATQLNGKVWIFGGFNGTECLQCGEVYDPSTNQWSLIAPMRNRRSGVSCIAYHGSIYVLGGFNGISRMCSGERYDPETNTWTNIPDMYNPRSNFAIEIIDDMIFCVGGFNGVTTIAHVECFDERTNEWYEATDMGLNRSALSCCVVTDIPNIQDYIVQDREHLIEERRQHYLRSTANNNNAVPAIEPRPIAPIERQD